MLSFGVFSKGSFTISTLEIWLYPGSSLLEFTRVASGISALLFSSSFSFLMRSLSVRGFEPELFYIEVYPKTEYVINEVPKVPRFSFGVQAGYGVSGQGLHPYIGLGVTYNLIGF